MTSPGDELDDAPKPFLAHLEDLRRTVVWCVAAVAIGIVAVLPFSPHILRLLKWPVARAGRDPETFLRILTVTGGMMLTVKMAFWSGLLLSAPVMVLAIANFVFPGLTRRERVAARNGAVAAVGLFLFGVLLCYFAALPVAVRVMLGINTWLGQETEFVLLADYVTFALSLMLAFGLAFQLPIVIVALGSLGIVTSQQLREKRRHAVVAILILAMFMTPGPDVFSQVLMAVPMVILYEGCIWIVRGKERRRGEALPAP